MGLVCPIFVQGNCLSCLQPQSLHPVHAMHQQPSFHWLPHRAHSAEGNCHFTPGKELHAFMKKFPLPVYSPNPLYPCASSSFEDCCPCLAQLPSPGRACLPAVPPLHACAVITPWQGIADRDPCGSVLELQLVGIVQRELSHNTTTCFHADF